MKVKVVLGEKKLHGIWPARWADDNGITVIHTDLISSNSAGSKFIFTYDIPNEEEAMIFRLRWT